MELRKRIALLTYVYLVTQVIPTTRGECVFPTTWYQPSYKKFWQYNDPSGASAMWMSTYSGDSSGFTLGLMSSKNLMEAMVLNHVCSDTYRPDPSGPTTYMVRVSFNQFACRAMTTTASGIFIREKQVPRGTSAESCQQSNNLAPSAFWEVQYPEMVGTRCPFAQGDYQVAVQGGSFCSGDAQTAATVQDDYLIIYCVSGDQFANEAGRMRCFDTLAGSLLDSDSNGGILLMEDRATTTNSGRLSFRCVRYGESGDTVKLKWRMLNTYALCVGGVSYATPAQDNFMALTMIRSGSIVSNPGGGTTWSPTTLVPEPCAYPEEWWSPRQWWYRTGSTGQLVYVQEFAAKQMQQRSIVTNSRGAGTIATLGTYLCSDQVTRGSRIMYVQFEQSVGRSRRCVEYVRVPELATSAVPDTILTRESQLGDGSLTAVECAVELIPIQEFTLLVPFPFDPASRACVFDNGYYATTFATSPDENVCVGSGTSVTSVACGSVTINSCAATNTYEMPVSTRLYHVTSFPSTDLYDANRDDGDFVVLAFQDPSTERYHFYCGRYRKTGNDYEMSLNVNDKYRTTCDTSARFDSAGLVAGKQYLKFSLTYLQAITPSSLPRVATPGWRTTLRHGATTLSVQTSQANVPSTRLSTTRLPRATTTLRLEPPASTRRTTTVVTTASTVRIAPKSTSKSGTSPEGTTRSALGDDHDTGPRPTRRDVVTSREISTLSTLSATEGKLTTQRPSLSGSKGTSTQAPARRSSRVVLVRRRTTTPSADFNENKFVTNVSPNRRPSTLASKELTTVPAGVTVRQNTCSACLNGAECIVSSVGAISCDCPPGTTGSRCETDLPVGRCEDQLCNLINTRKCTNAQGGFYFCQCFRGFSGPRCQTNVNECASNPCQNGGACQDGDDGFECQCSVEYSGQTCQFKVASATGDGSNDLTVLIVLIVLLAGVVLAVVVVSVCMCHYRSEQREKALIVDNDEISQAYGGSSIQAWYPDYKSNNSDSGSIGRHP